MRCACDACDRPEVCGRSQCFNITSTPRRHHMGMRWEAVPPRTCAWNRCCRGRRGRHVPTRLRRPKPLTARRAVACRAHCGHGGFGNGEGTRSRNSVRFAPDWWGALLDRSIPSGAPGTGAPSGGLEPRSMVDRASSCKRSRTAMACSTSRDESGGSKRRPVRVRGQVKYRPPDETVKVRCSSECPRSSTGSQTSSRPTRSRSGSSPAGRSGRGTSCSGRGTSRS